MDIFLILIIIFMAFVAFRSYLRGALISFIDTASLFIATVIATSFFDQFVYFLYTTNFYRDAKKSIAGMMDFNTILANNNSSSEIVGNVFVIPTVIQKFGERNNTPDVYSRIGVNSFDEYITDVFTHIIIITLAFAIVFAIAYVIMYLVRILIIPHLHIIALGKVDKCISIFLGIIKSVIYLFLFVTLIPLLFTEFNYYDIYVSVCNSPILNYLYNLNPILTELLSSVSLQ